jgi:alcohol dehydrogenase
VAAEAGCKLLIIKRLVPEKARAWVGGPEAIRRNALKTRRLWRASGRLLIKYLLPELCVLRGFVVNYQGMKALFFEGRKARVIDAPEPRARAGYAKVKVLVSGICNTDLELLRGYYGFSGIPGHEFVGRVVSPGSPLAGRRVVGEINLACGRCSWCATGLGRHCPRRAVLGIVKHPGAHAEYLTLPERNLSPVPDSVPDEEAVFTEPLAAACEILEQLGSVEGRKTAVLGAGKLGLLAAQVLAQAGADVSVFGRRPEKLRMARRLGLDARPAPVRAPRAQFDLVVEATGTAAGLPRAIQMTRPRGTVVMKSTFHGLARFDAAPLVVNEITVVGSRCGRFAPALDLLARRAVQVRPLISAEYPLSRAPAALRHAARPSSVKVLLRP